MLDLDLDVTDIPIVEVATDSLLPGFSPRLAAHSEQNVRLLMEVDGALPPILVLRKTNQVIDGMHRLLAARRRGQEKIAVRYYDCDEASAFVLAVRANVAHGLALSLSERKAAAGRILRCYADWSDRRIARATGLSDKTVATIRGYIHGEVEEASRRIGLDGRARAVNAVARRREVASLFAEEPGLSLRHVAKRTGVSPETVRLAKLRASRTDTRPASAARAGAEAPNPQLCLAILVKDPALRSTDAGRLLLRTLSAFPQISREAEQLLDVVPVHDLAAFARLAAANAQLWQELAEGAGRRLQPGGESGSLVF